MTNLIKTVVKKPIEVQALQWDDELPGMWALMCTHTNNLVRTDPGMGDLLVYDRLHDSWIKFSAGDWIVRGTKGECYPVEAEIFPTIYEVKPNDK